MGRQRDEELWVAAMVRAALGRVVLHHDDGSRDGMYDLLLAPSEGVDGAMEVVAAADAESIEFWNPMNGRDTRWVEEDLDGGWLVVVDPAARVHRLRKELPGLLAALEGAGVARMRTTRHAPGGVDRLTVEFGLHSARQSGTDFKGSIYVTVKRDLEFTGERWQRRVIRWRLGSGSSSTRRPAPTFGASCRPADLMSDTPSCCCRASPPRPSWWRTY